MTTIGSLLILILWIAIVLLLARFILDWVRLLARQWRPQGMVAVLCEGIYAVSDPPLRTVRGVIPPIRLGGAALDLSPMILLFGLYILMQIVYIAF
jgi:YggT family protein|tara:strand:- start:133 stop:420 length:288 start_codon:yes stop_codon:yes gene_type:complete